MSPRAIVEKGKEKGLDIIRGLHGHTSGYAVPAFVIDAPGGGGKAPLTPEYVVGRDGNDWVLRNYRGEIYRYRDPSGFEVLDFDDLNLPGIPVFESHVSRTVGRQHAVDS